MSMQRCPSCDAWIDERHQPRLGPWRCDACGMRFSAPRREGIAAEPGFRDDDGLGIHPALARRYKRHGTPAHGTPPATMPSDAPHDELDAADDEQPTIQLSPSLVNEGAGETDEPEGLGPLAARAARAERTRPLRKGGQSQSSSASVPAAGGSPSAEQGADDASARSKEPRKDSAQDPLPEANRPFPEIPGYRFEAVVGKGAMGCVYRALHEASGDKVAVKLLAKELAARDDFIARFEREAAALKAVDHPGVVTVLDRGAAGEHHFLAMPFVEGDSMRRTLGKGPLQPIRALGFMRQICQALGAAHAKKVIHRDLKPENILVQRVNTGSGVYEKLVLVDFGLAGMGEDDPHPNLTKSRMTMGTVNYMAPEQRTDAKRVGPQADVYAAGVILYELLTGDLPLGRFKMPSARPGMSHLPKKIDECVDRALDRDPESRYATCAEMDLDLAQIEKELDAQASRDTVVGRVSRTHPSEEGASTEVASQAPAPGSGAAAPSADTTPDLGAELNVASGGGSSKGPRSSKGPQWVTAPPWVKRPLLVWGTLALLVGGAIGVWTSPEDGDLPATDDAVLLALGQKWRPRHAGWSVEAPRLQWNRSADDEGFSRIARDETLPDNDIFAKFVIDLPPEAWTWGGIVIEGGGLQAAIVIKGDRTCAQVDLRALAAKPKSPVLKPLKCAVPQSGPVAVTLRCDETVVKIGSEEPPSKAPKKTTTCRARVGGGPFLPLTGLNAELNQEPAESPWKLDLICGGSACSFATPEGVRTAK